jgi:hypothetical protein
MKAHSTFLPVSFFLAKFRHFWQRNWENFGFLKSANSTFFFLFKKKFQKRKKALSFPAVKNQYNLFVLLEINLCNFFHLRGEEEPYTRGAIFFVDAEILCIMRPQQTLKYFVNSLHKYNRPMEKAPILRPKAIAWRVSKSGMGQLWGGAVAFPPANTSSPAQKPKGQSLDQWFRYLQIHNGW